MITLRMVLYIGLLGSFLMFLGDMFLYYDKEDYDSEDTLNSIVNLMKKNSRKRLYIGGILGPISSFFYCIGFYHIVLFIDEKFILAGWIGFLICCLGIVFGGSYHSNFAYLGLIGRHEEKKTLEEVYSFLNIQRVFTFGFLALGLVFLMVFIVFGWTILPRWMVVLTPGVLMLILPLLKGLPKS